MVKGPRGLAKFAGSWIFEATDPHSTLARFRYTVSTHPAWLAWLGDRLAAAYFSRTTRKRLTGLKRYCESLAATGVEGAGIRHGPPRGPGRPAVLSVPPSAAH